MHLSLLKLFPLFILASSLCWSFQCLISPLTQGGVSGHLFRLTCSVMLWGGRNTANKYHWLVWGVLAAFQSHWVCPRSRHMCFHSLHCSGSRLLCQELSEASPGLHALPRSKPLSFRFSGTPQRRRLGLACVLCLSQVQAAQVTRCLASTVAPSWRLHLISSPISAAWFSGCTTGRTFSGMPCVSSGELISGCNPPGRCQLSRIPTNLG